MPKVITQRMSSASWRRVIWTAYTRVCSFIIPDVLLICLSSGRLKTKARLQAWREKFALFSTYIIIGALFCFWLEYITELFCDLPPTFSYREVFYGDSHMSSINGEVVDWNYLGNSSDLSRIVNLYPRRDLSLLFPKFMLLQREENEQKYSNHVIDACINGINRSAQADNWLNYKLATDSGYLFENNKLISCPIPTQRNATGSPCFYTSDSLQEYNRYPKKGTLQIPLHIVSNLTTLPIDGYNGTAYVVLDNSVLDVTDYLNAATNLVIVAKNAYSRSFALNRMFLPLDLTILLFSNLGRDITSEFYSVIPEPYLYKDCLNELFFRGVVDGNADEGCARVNLALWITLGCFLLYFLVKMNLAILSRLRFMQKFLYNSAPSNGAYSTTRATLKRQKSNANYRNLQPHVLFFIPCFAESSTMIRQTLDSLARTNYPDTKKLLFFVCDGIVKSKLDSKESYLCILDALGYSSSNEPEIRPYISLGQGLRRVNYAKVFSGFYESGSNRVPFIMVVKVGSPTELLCTSRISGNRGKRDSLILVLGFLERCINFTHNRITPLEFEIFNQCYNILGVDPREIKYMLTTDADTQVQDDVVLKMVSKMEENPKLSAVSGHIRPANPEENILTMFQLFPLYMTFYSGLAYEACLGRVTTVNGGFVMYRIWSKFEDGAALKTSAESTNDIEMVSTGTSKRVKNASIVKRPKLSDEIVSDKDDDTDSASSIDASKRVIINLEVDNSSSDENSKNANYNTTTTIESRHKTHRRRRVQKQKMPKTGGLGEPLNLTTNSNIQLCCAHPTVLRKFAAMQPDTMHLENILLSGEEQFFSIVLLTCLNDYHLSFEPEAIGYVTIPTNFFALQALVTRNLRAAFHMQVEFFFAARHLGISYWIISFTKLLDIIFTMPLTVYLYSVFIRYFIYKHLVFGVIVIAFTILLCVYIVLFLLHLQFKFIIWLFLYCLFSVLLFNVYFPLIAAWCSDFGNCWRDAYPSKSDGCHCRLHGIVMDEDTDEHAIDEEESNAEEFVARMRLGDFEVVEAEKAAKREKEQAEILDAKFSDFTGYINTATVNVMSHLSKPSWSSALSSITVPPSAQLRDSKTRVSHSRYASEEDAHLLLSPSSRSPTRPDSSNGNCSPRNPFVSTLDDPFDDMYIQNQDRPDRTPPLSTIRGHHRKTSSSRLSNFGRHSVMGNNPHKHENKPSSGTDNLIYHYRSQSSSSSRNYPSSELPSPINTPKNEEARLINDNDSIVSLNPSFISSVFSLEAVEDATDNAQSFEEDGMNHNPHRIIGGAQYRPSKQTFRDVVSEGRSAPIHSRFTANQP